MDKHQWKSDGDDYEVERKSEVLVLRRGGKLVLSRNPAPDSPVELKGSAAILEELLRLAERAQLADLAAEEGREIIAELSMALAILAGEDLKPCMAPCPGHLREKANEAMRAALVAWRALQEGNRRAAERIRELEARADNHLDVEAAIALQQSWRAAGIQEIQEALLRRATDAEGVEIKSVEDVLESVLGKAE